MKPHIRLRYGIWSCATLRPIAIIGCGRSPREAYAEWHSQAHQ